MFVSGVDTPAVLGDLVLEFGVQVTAVHLGEGRGVEGDVGQFPAEGGSVLASGGEGFADFADEQGHLQWHVGGIEPLLDLVSQVCFCADRMSTIPPGHGGVLVPPELGDGLGAGAGNRAPVIRPGGIW
ncbi:hypothetical protein ACH4FX_22055 [Streptomyces sp. NPDC018019]|uniref:hypothetical protein n=1 Tax=Streptomyces sp. NPDC018019 TaxID=3365030 RepID=UPI00379C805E